MRLHRIFLHFTLIYICAPFDACAQKEEPCSPCRTNAVIGIGAVSAVGSYYMLDQLWYSQYARSSFHTFNDNNEWLQMDKAGHIMTCYTIGRYSSEILQWTGMNKTRSIWTGGSIGFIYMTGIEILDGRSKQWGFSWGDMIANATGSFCYIAQEKIWNDQRIVFKFSYTPSSFADQYPDQFGQHFQQRILKDYNAQTYWASINVSSFLASDAVFPKWLNVAAGYGATKMMNAKTNIYNVDNSKQQREFYLSFDADLTRVGWEKKWMKRTAKIFNFIKLPSPTLEANGSGRVKMHWLFF
ncbi:MAG: DUF2279 domain-containing protein [Flavobacteriales bacterium]